MKLKLFAILILIAAGGAAVLVSIGGLPASGSAATTYLTAAATLGDITDEVAATGTIEATATYALGFGGDPQLVSDTATSAGQGTWRVTSVEVQVGQAVRQGDVLAAADTSDLRTELGIAEFALRNATTQETIAEEALEDASGTDELRQARINYRNAVNGRRQATQARDDLEAQLGHAQLIAPLDGTISAVNIAAGSDSTGTAITIAAGTFQVTADVVESDISSMLIGQAATVTVDAIDAVIDGTVSLIAPAAAAGTSSVVSYPVTVTLTGGPAALRSGMTADITIVTASATGVLTVPSSALRGTSGSYRVQVLAADGTPTTRDVTVGLVTSASAEIRSGLSEGETVVIGTSADQQGTTVTTVRDGFGGGGIAIPGTGPGGGFQRP